MSSPIGHSLAGLTMYTLAKHLDPKTFASRKNSLLFMALALLPDADILAIRIGILPFSGHRTVTHSITFSIFAGLFIALVYWCLSGKRSKTLWWIFPATIFTHCMMDLTCRDYLPPYGIQIFWPFSHHFFNYPLYFMTSVGTYAAVGNPTWLAFLKSATMEAFVMGSLYLLVRCIISLNFYNKTSK